MLIKMCREAVTATELTVGNAACFGYLNGVSDLAEAIALSSSMSYPDPTSAYENYKKTYRSLICGPNPMSGVQGAAVVVKFLTEHPGKWQENGADLVMQAYRESFCPEMTIPSEGEAKR